MTNFFAGIHRASEALTTARYGLDVTAQNIANANTPGYTRQRADQVSIGAMVGVPTLHSGTVDNGGVRATGASRLGDVVLDARTRAEHARSAQVDTQRTRLADIENIFQEPSDTGLAEQLSDLWNAWGDVANNPDGQVPREMLLSTAQSTVTMLRAKNAALDDVATAAQTSLNAKVQSANTAAGELSELNRQISIGQATGANINTLLDQRDMILDDLATSIGAVATLHENGTASVTVGGADLVTVGPAGKPPFAVKTLTSTTTDITPTNVTVAFAVDGASVTLGDSAVAAEAKAISQTVPLYRSKLDAVARDLATVIKNAQENGYDLDGASGAGMFSNGAGSLDPADITAGNITVSITDWKKIAASDEQSTDNGLPTGTPIGNRNGQNALLAAQLGGSTTGPDATYSSLVGDLGRAASSAKQQQATQNVITASVDTLKATASGVSFDEEVSNMLTYQMAFQASSRVLTALDEMLDTLINRTGMVGR